MNERILYIPLDERPCNAVYPAYLAQIANVPCIMPPRTILGDFKKPADTEKIWEWLHENASGASHAVISMDTLCYGGIVPSRLHQLSREECDRRIDRLRLLKQEFPQLVIYAFQLITRAPARNGSGEEPDYYEEHGYDIHRYGVVTDMEAGGVATQSELTEKAGILQRVPQTFLQDFIRRRAVNFDSNVHSIQLAADGILDFLVIPLDDCKEYGYAPAERRRLAAILAEKNMLSKVPMYPGADEMGCTMMARAIASLTGVRPEIWLEYSSNRGMLTTPSYEDRSIGETTAHHLLTAGARQALDGTSADCALFVNPPTAFSLRLEKELPREQIFLETERNLRLLTERIRQYTERGLDCYVGDSAIPNGAEVCLMQFLYEQELLDEIEGYSGWNTNSNAMGTVVGHAVAYACAKKSGRLNEQAKEKSREFRFYRYMEDWGYMSRVRGGVSARLKEFGPTVNVLDLKDKEPQVARHVTERLREFQKQYLPQYPYTIEATMPWNRMFEIDLQIK